MKMSNVVILVCGIFFVFAMVFSYNNQTAVRYSRANIQYANKLTNACLACVEQLEVVQEDPVEGVWKDKSTRIETLSIFYKCLAQNLSMHDEIDINAVKDKTPVAILADIDGFYISYNACYDEYGNAVVPDSLEEVNVVSELNTYVGTYNGHTVRYYLNDYVDVTLKNGEYHHGLRNEVYYRFPTSVRSDLAFLINDNDFEQIKAEAVAGTIESVLNYYFNTQMINVQPYNTGYQVSIPRSKGEYWARTISNPTFISLLQGPQEYVDGRVLNVYAYASAEVCRKQQYFICNGRYYYLDSALNIQKIINNGITEYYFNGIKIDAFYNSMEDCAKTGATPSEQIL